VTFVPLLSIHSSNNNRGRFAIWADRAFLYNAGAQRHNVVGRPLPIRVGFEELAPRELAVSKEDIDAAEQHFNSNATSCAKTRCRVGRGMFCNGGV